MRVPRIQVGTFRSIPAGEGLAFFCSVIGKTFAPSYQPTTSRRYACYFLLFLLAKSILGWENG